MVQRTGLKYKGIAVSTRKRYERQIKIFYRYLEHKRKPDADDLPGAG
mgnify:CR=1 FL=1